MDMHRTAKEIGLFLTAINLVAVMDSPDVQDKVGASMPLPDFPFLPPATTHPPCHKTSVSDFCEESDTPVNLSFSEIVFLPHSQYVLHP